MILVRDKGQMCNNIFQFAHSYAWARENGIRAVSMRFAYKYQYFKICHTKYHNLFFYLLGKWGAALKLIPVADFNTPNAAHIAANEQKLLNHSYLCVLEGWHIRYFDLVEKYLDEIRELFSFDAPVMKSAESKLNELTTNRDHLIGVHIRRGDYATFMGGRFYLSDDCYIDCIRQTASLMPDDKTPTVVICSNDRKLRIDYFRQQLPGMNVTLSNGNAAEDLYTLSQCSHIIGPASSFSLVATLYGKARLAFISKEVGKITTDSFCDFTTMSRRFDKYFAI